MTVKKHIANKVDSCLQNHRGRAAVSQKWVFGMVDTSHTSALGYMKMFVCKYTLILLPITQSHVHPGTIIHIQPSATIAISCKHDTVYHSVALANLTTGMHTENIGIG